MDSVISVRSVIAKPDSSLDTDAFCLYFGNGCARGVAAMVAWMHMLKVLSNRSSGSDHSDQQPIMAWMLTFLNMPTKYERIADGSPHASLLTTIARQEQDANVDGGLYGGLDPDRHCRR